MSTAKKTKTKGGPVTPRGKARSSTNATRHGLRSRGLLLPGESVRDYRRHLAAFFSALEPTSDAEARLVKGVGDALWTLNRWQRVEHRATLDNLEHAMKKTAPYRLLDDVRDALQVLAPLIEVTEQVPVPNPQYLTPFISGCRGCLVQLEKFSERPKTLAKFRHVIEELDRAATGDVLTSYQAVGDAAVQLAAELTRMVKPAEERLKKLRDDLGALTTPDEAVMKKLTRYHGMLSKVASDQLDLITKMREVTRRKKAEKKGSSFGTGGKAPTTHLLRVVK